MAVRTDHLALGNLLKDTPFAAPQAKADVEQLLATHVVEIHHSGRIPTAAFSAWNTLEGSDCCLQSCVPSLVRTLGLVQVVLAVSRVMVVNEGPLARLAVPLPPSASRAIHAKVFDRQPAIAVGAAQAMYEELRSKQQIHAKKSFAQKS